MNVTVARNEGTVATGNSLLSTSGSSVPAAHLSSSVSVGHFAMWLTLFDFCLDFELFLVLLL
jgi:hypothetical protein